VRVRALLAEEPEMPATVLAERVGWEGSITWFRQNVKRLRPEHRPSDPADRLVWEAGDAAQCDLWFPPKRIPLEDGSTTLLPVLVITAAHSRFMLGRWRRIVTRGSSHRRGSTPSRHPAATPDPDTNNTTPRHNRNSDCGHFTRMSARREMMAEHLGPDVRPCVRRRVSARATRRRRTRR
jgi:hypothetical protein